VQVSKITIGQLNPAAYNPRKDLQPGDPEYEKLKRSIQEFGYVEPIVWNKRTGNIVGGHQRYKVLLDMGMSEVDCVVVDLDETKEKALNIALNKIQGDWDNLKLKDLLQELDTGEFDIELTGFGMDEIEDLMTQFHVPGEIVEDEAPEPPEEPVTKPGDLWLLGRHRLLCGDATVAADVERLMDGKKADMVFTDPPYGVNVKGGKGKGNTIAGDLTQTAIPISFEICVKQATKDKARFYFCGGEGNIGLYFKLFERYLAQMPKLLIWVKNGFVLRQNGYHNQYELIFYGFKAGGGGKEYWYSGRTEDEASDVWRVSRDASTSYLHPTQKPIELPARAIRNSSKAGDTIYDPFGGSGSTLIACEQLNRTCYMMEIDPVYCDVIIKRWENFTGQKAELLDK
jgi:DNA modification methylase